MKAEIKHRTVAADVLHFIETHPDQHDQGSWFNPPIGRNQREDNIDPEICGTTLCTAGTAIYLTHGVDALIEPYNYLNAGYFDSGKELLGLDDAEASLLFYESNEKEAVRILDCIVRGDQEGIDKIGVEVLGDDDWRDWL